MSVTVVGKPTGTIHPLRNTRGITLERSLTNVVSVESPLAIIRR